LIKKWQGVGKHGRAFASSREQYFNDESCTANTSSGLPGVWRYWQRHAERPRACQRKENMNNLSERITRHPFFWEMKPEHLAILVRDAKEETFRAGEVLFHQDEPADRFLLIESGCIALETHQPAGGTVLVQELGPGEVVGWSWLFSPFAWHFCARAAEPTTAIVLSGAHLLVTAEKDHEFGYELMKRVAQVVIHRLQATREQLLSSKGEAALAN
jgi:CRP/FNR family cyclic AMP-dependent transcriptional regulator